MIRPSAKGWQSYQQVATQTASRGQLVLMLFDGAVRFLEQALAGFEQEDPGLFNLTINNNVQRAQAIVDELNGSLDMGQGADLARHLRDLYNYLDRRLDESNRTKSPRGHPGIHRTPGRSADCLGGDARRLRPTRSGLDRRRLTP